MLYLLIPLTIGLWGVIIYRIVNPVSGNDEFMSYNNALIHESKELILSDTFSIECNYPDPFLGKKISKMEGVGSKSSSAVSLKVKNAKEKKQIVTQTIVWPEIIYRGIIKNQKSNKQLALVQINGKGNTMRTGDKVDNIELTKVFKDSIEVRFGKEKRYVRQ